MALPPPLRAGACSIQAPALWWAAVCAALDQLCARIEAAAVRAIAVDATSATLLLTDAAGAPLGEALMYDDARAVAEAVRIVAVAPATSAAQGATSALAKLLYLQAQPAFAAACHALHQADWIAGRLCGRFGVSDWNNALKLGFDPVARQWPAWLDALHVPPALLPEALEPGTPIALLLPEFCVRWGFTPDTHVVAGTTDSTAAVIASGISEPGEAVTVLGSTLVVKLLSEQPINDAANGVYSHPFGNLWLVGGASNSGGRVLQQFFAEERIAALSAQLEPDTPTGLDYYPLPARGERFPVNDPLLEPRLMPRPEDDRMFFQALLEGIARIERMAYQRLATLGAPRLRRIVTLGGGAANHGWARIRDRMLGVPLSAPLHREAAYGTALLARQGFE